MDAAIWITAFVIFLIAELSTVQLVSIWFAVGALVTLICSCFFDMTILEQLGVFIGSSGVFLLITLPYLKKRKNLAVIPTNADLDVGKTAVVIEEINVDKGTGRATLAGVDWAALPENGSDVIPTGAIVIVRKVDGAKLVVALKKEKAT